MSAKPKTLFELFQAFPNIQRSIDDRELLINNIVSDSRKVKPGDLFVAFEGEYSDGHQFIAKAIAAGAVAIIGDREIELGGSIPYIQVDDARKMLAHLAAAFYDHPARKLALVGVTGTDGKTTTSNMIYWLLKKAGYKVGLVSTVNAVIGDEMLDTGFHVTTPDAMDLQAILARMVDSGLTHVVLETTSHGWAQYRVDACEFDVGVVTNITHEHLDYHKTYENYLSAKARLFLSLNHNVEKPYPVNKVAVVNKDDSSYDHLQKFLLTKTIAYGGHATSDRWFSDVQYQPEGLAFRVHTECDEHKILIPVFGEYNIYNALAAISCAVDGFNIPLDTIVEAFATFPGISGRMERIDLGQEFTAFVDFAHTPNALRAALETSRKILDQMGCEGCRVIAVFGSAGLRDREKRKMMASVSAKLADISVLTAEDPRTENLDAILDEMAGEAVASGGVLGESVIIEPDRPDALRVAVRLAKPGDVVIACGKGHEQSMCFGDVEYPWDDRVALRSALAELLTIDTNEKMPVLPTSKWDTNQ